MAVRASIGFRVHTGWAMVVAVAAEGEPLRVLRRCRMELLPPGQGRFVYHRAAELALADAGRLIESVRKTAEDTTRTAMRGAIEDLTVIGACMAAGSASVAGRPRGGAAIACTNSRGGGRLVCRRDRGSVRALRHPVPHGAGA